MDSFSDASVNLSNFWGQYTHEATCMPRQHQDSLLDAARQGDVWVHHILQFYSHVKYSPLASSVRVIYVAFCCYTAPDIQPFFD